MARFLFTLWPMDTHIPPGLAVAESLQKRGHEVAFFTAADFCPQVEAEGFPCFPFQKLEEARVGELLAALMEHWNKPWRTRKLWHQFLIDTVPAQLQDLDHVLERFRADVIVCDMAMWGPMLILAETWRIPVAILSHVGYCILPGKRRIHPAVSRGLRGNGIGGMYTRALSLLMKLGTREIQRGANRLRMAHGLGALQGTVVEHTGTMPLYLVPSSPELDYGRDDLPSSVHYVGPYLSAGNNTSRQKSHPPRVLVIEGANHGSDPWLLRTGATALAGQPLEVIPVTGLDRKTKEAEVTAIVPGVRFLSLSDREQWIADADAVVTGGSSEIILPALSHGVPLVMAPSILEESAMSRRVADYGAGVLIPAKRCTPARLQAAVARVLHEPSFRRQAGSAAETFRRCGGPQRAAFLLEGLSSGASTQMPTTANSPA